MGIPRVLKFIYLVISFDNNWKIPQKDQISIMIYFSEIDFSSDAAAAASTLHNIDEHKKKTIYFSNPNVKSGPNKYL